MDKLFNSTFDFLSYALPGSLLLSSALVLNPQISDLSELIEFAAQIPLHGMIIILIFSYTLGFALYPIGRGLYRSLGFRLWKQKIPNDVPLFIADKYALLRELAPANFKYVENWNIYCAMGHNLALAAAGFALFSLIKVLWQQPENIGYWLLLASLSLFLFFCFLNRAVVFSNWAAIDINAAITRLNLLEKAQKN